MAPTGCGCARQRESTNYPWQSGLVTTTPNGTFFAYASQPPLRAETMRQVITGLNGRGHIAVGWEQLAIDGRVLVDAITAEIDSQSSFLAEISSMNFNVLFELGYAIAKNKPTWLAFDETDVDAERAWADVAILATVGRSEYGGNAEKLIARFFANPPASTPPLGGSILAGAKPREENAVFAPSLPIKITAATTLERYLERQTHLKILASSEDLMIAPLEFYAREIYRSSAVILHLLGTRRRRASEHNARASFLAGFAHGLSLPMLMVVESGFTSPLDYRDLLYQYDTSAGLIDKVAAWLESLPKVEGTQRRLGRLELDIELPIRSFGQYVAEYETEELGNYFVQTSEFAAIVAGEAKVFAGRKGTGKTANMSQVAGELARDRRILVVSLKPASYELSGLVGALQRFDTPGHAEYFLVTVWMYLIQTEVALRAREAAGERARPINEERSLESLGVLLQQMGLASHDDLSARLELIVDQTMAQLNDDESADPNLVARALRSDYIDRLRDLTLDVCGGFRRIAILIDNLDKNWEKGADFAANAQFILSLLIAAGRIEKSVKGHNMGRPDDPIEATLAVFIRTDILDAVRSYAREADKIGARTVDWDDEQLLVRVLEERYAANRTRKSTGTMWDELFCPEVRGLPTRDYFLWRALRRPRDFIYFANSALTTAINRRHAIIEASDVVYAEREYSRFAIEALLVESDPAEFDLEAVLYEFAGVGATVAAEELTGIFGNESDPGRIQDWLIASSFLGIEIGDDKFEYVEGEVAAKRKTRVARRNSESDDRPLRYRIHPAFRPYLEIRDDDLHG